MQKVSTRLKAIATHPLEIWRADADVSKAQVAVGIEVTRPFLYRLLSGECRPSSSLMRRIILYTDHAVTADDCVLWDPQKVRRRAKGRAA